MTTLAALLLALASAQAPALPQAPAPTPAPPDAATSWEQQLVGLPPLVTLELPQALAELDRLNPRMEEARQRAAASLGVVRQAAAPLLPTLQAGGGYFHNNAEVVFAAPAPGGVRTVYIQPGDAWQATGALRVPLLVMDGWLSLAASREAALAAAAGSDATRLSMRTALLQAAWLAWAWDQGVAASERAVADAREQARSARRQVKVGTAAPLTVLQADTAATRRESDLVQARSERARARIALGALLGRSGPVAVTLPPLPPATGYDLDLLAREALGARPELRAQAALVRSFEKQADAALWRIAPQLSASASGSGQTVPYPTGDKSAWRVSVDLTWTLYDGGYRYGKADQAGAQAAEARAAETGTRLQVLEEVQNATRDVEVARARLALAESERATATEAAASARRGFKEGVTSSLDVLSANEVLYLSEIQVAQAQGRLGGSLAALDRAVGRVP